jgi:putative glutamine amidotransferase
MTNIVAATDDFREDFEWSFGESVDIVSLTQWSYNLNTYDLTSVDFRMVEEADLVIFTGGEDISPEIYGQKNTYSTVNTTRDNAEIAILKCALSLNRKILGVCRGHQLINAFLGGVLVQDLVQCLNTDHSHYHSLVPLDDGGKVTEIFTSVNSMHHQGVTKVGNSLKATSLYRGVVESCESPNIITTQFHPEFMGDTQSKTFFNYIKSWIGE